RNTTLRSSVRSDSAYLHMNIEVVRCLLIWVAFDALFGPEDGREITYRLSQRLGFLLGSNRNEAKELFQTARTGYGFRSKIVHGRWKEDPTATIRMAEAESLFRAALAKIIETPTLVNVFSTREREGFLDNLVFDGAA